MLSCHFPAPMIPTLFSVSRRIRQNSKGKFKKDHLFWGGWGEGGGIAMECDKEWHEGKGGEQNWLLNDP